MAVGLSDTLGAFFIGTVTACILFGINCLQTFIYYTRYEKDRPLMKIFVGSLWIVDFAHLVLVLYSLYFYCVLSFTNLLVLLITTRELVVSSFISLIGNSIIRCFFAFRVYNLSRNRYITGFILILCAVGFGASIDFNIKWLQNTNYFDLPKIAGSFYLVFSANAAVDIAIASSLCYYFHKWRTGSKSTDSLLATLTIYSINTGLVTCLAHVAILITFASLQGKLVYAAIFFCSPKLYYGALLASLNARDKLRGRFSDAEFSDLTGPSTSGFTGQQRSGSTREEPVPIEFAEVSKAESVAV